MKIVHRKKNPNLRWIIQSLSLASFLFLGVGCSENTIVMNSIDGNWHKNDVQKFSFEIENHQVPRNIIFVVRNNNEYPYSNLRVFATLKGEEDKTNKVDTLHYILAQPNGKWLGSGFGETKEILFQYKNTYQFPKNGKYSIEIKQAMRSDSLKGIEDIGIEIQPVK